MINDSQIQNLLMKLDRLKALMYLYQKRIATARQGYFEKNEFEKNEIEILIYKTENEIEDLSNDITKATRDLQNVIADENIRVSQSIIDKIENKHEFNTNNSEG